jgi:hypothetical protein
VTGTKVTIEGDMTVKMVKSLLEGLPVSWRLVGQEDGSIIAAPAVRRSRIEEEEYEDEEDADEQ